MLFVCKPKVETTYTKRQADDKFAQKALTYSRLQLAAMDKSVVVTIDGGGA